MFEHFSLNEALFNFDDRLLPLYEPTPPNLFGVAWGLTSIPHFMVQSFTAQLGAYLDETVRWDDPRYVLWYPDDELRTAVSMNYTEYGYDAMYSDYPPNEEYGTEPLGRLLALRLDPIDARGFTYVCYPAVASVSGSMGREAYKDIAATASEQAWPISPTTTCLLVYLRFAFWEELAYAHGYYSYPYHHALDSKAYAHDFSNRTWGIGWGDFSYHVEATHDGYFESGFEFLGDFEKTFPMYVLMDPDFYELPAPDLSPSGSLHTPWYVTPNPVAPDARDPGWTHQIPAVGRVSARPDRYIDAVVLYEELPVVLCTGGSAFLADDSLYFWTWLVWYKVSFSTLYFDELVLDPSISLESHEDYLDIFKKIRLIPGRWLDFIFLKGTHMEENPWYTFSEPWFTTVLPLKYTLESNMEYYVPHDMVEFPVFNQPAYTLLEYARPWPEGTLTGEPWGATGMNRFLISAEWARYFFLHQPEVLPAKMAAPCVVESPPFFYDGFFNRGFDAIGNPREEKHPESWRDLPGSRIVDGPDLPYSGDIILDTYFELHDLEVVDTQALRLSRCFLADFTSKTTGIFFFDKDPELELGEIFPLISKNKTSLSIV